MADIRINDLPPDATPSGSDNLAVDGASTRRSTVEEVVLAGRPTATQAEAEAGTDNFKAMTPLTVVQSIAANGATAAQGALADTALQPGNIGGTVQGYYAALQSMGSTGIAADQIFYGTGVDALATTALTPFARTLIDDATNTTALATLQAPGLNIPNTFTQGQTVNRTGGPVGIVVNRTDSTNNSVYEARTTDGSTFFGRANGGFAVDDDNNISTSPHFFVDGTDVQFNGGSLQTLFSRGLMTTPEDHGAVGDGVTDDSTAMLAWFAEVRAGAIGVMGGPGKNYLITSGNTLTSANESVIIFGNGATITQNSNSRTFLLENTYDDIVTVTSFSSLNYDFGGGATPVTRVNMSAPNRALFSVGQIIKVGGDNVIPTEENDIREAEFAQIGAIDGTGLVLTKKIQFPVGANPIAGRLRTEVKIHIQDLNIDHIGFTDTTSWANSRFDIQGAFQPRLINCTSHHSASQAFQFIGCLMQRAENCSAYNARTYTPANAFGYGFVEKHSEFGEYVNLKVYNCRHGFTTVGQGTTAGDGDLMRRGRNKYARVIGGSAAWCTSAAWDTHADSFNTEFHGCVASYPYLAGAGSFRMNYQLRGINDRAVGCKSFGTSRGYHINRVSGQSDPAQNGYCSIVDCEHVGDVSDTTDDAAFQVSSSSGIAIPFALIQGCRFQRNGSTAPFLRVDAAEVEVISPQIVGPNSTSGNYFDFLANEGAIINIRGGFSDNRGSHASASYRPFRSDEPGTFWDVDGFDIKTESGKFFTVVSAINASGGLEVQGWLRGLKTNFAPASLTSVGTQLTNALWVDINGGVATAYNGNADTEAYSTTGNKTLSISRRGGELVWKDVTTTASGVAINAINDGAFAGQLLTIRANTSSTNNLQITSGSGISLGSNVTLTPGDALRLIWTGSTWARA